MSTMAPHRQQHDYSSSSTSREENLRATGLCSQNFDQENLAFMDFQVFCIKFKDLQGLELFISKSFKF